MATRPDRHLSERDLRALSTADLLSLIQADISELDEDEARRERLERGPFHVVTCCNKRLGDFPPYALVRCPFCFTWHKASDFPQAR